MVHKVDPEVLSVFKRKKLHDILSRTELVFPTLGNKDTARDGADTVRSSLCAMLKSEDSDGGLNNDITKATSLPAAAKVKRLKNGELSFRTTQVRSPKKSPHPMQTTNEVAQKLRVARSEQTA